MRYEPVECHTLAREGGTVMVPKARPRIIFPNEGFQVRETPTEIKTGWVLLPQRQVFRLMLSLPMPGLMKTVGRWLLVLLIFDIWFIVCSAINLDGTTFGSIVSAFYVVLAVVFALLIRKWVLHVLDFAQHAREMVPVPPPDDG